ncbi:ABC transporter substrate-binding protein [uncultured Clostridium sp.]|uniref:ABC transporter substrate-binding protein n=1 Tax=uncultured Clostridium sp. TaxID=59620 RepID=UPI002600A015|nr:ABC transporter substrate-binding protein [uncultured Clostridium sp.]
MNKFIKKICAAGLISIIAGSMMACGAKNENGASQETKSDNGKIQIEYWYGLGGKLDESMQKIVTDFNNSQDKYEVKPVAQDDYDTTYKNLQAAISANKTPALALLEPDKQYTLGSKDLLTDINELASKDSEYKEDNYLSAFIGAGKQGDKLYAFPVYGTTQVLYYNTKAFADAGLGEDTMKTWTSLAEDAAKLVKKDGDEVSFYGWEPMKGSDNLVDAVLSNGGQVLSDDGKQVLINSDEWVEVWDSFRKWIHEDKIMRIHSGGQGWQYWNDTVADAMEQKTAGYTGSAGDQGDLDFSILSACEQPAFKDGKEAKPIAEARFLVIPKSVSEEQKQGAYEFIKFFTSAKVNAEWSIASGYIAVNKESPNDEAFKEYVSDKPYALVPTLQAAHASQAFIDPTGGKISDALKIAADKVEIENVSAKEALDEAQKTAQKALDELNK